MPRKPQPGGDEGTWGELLNEYLAVAHDDSGALRDGSVPDASATTKGLVQLTGDLGGTATAPTVPGLASRASVSALNSHTSNFTNPHNVTRAQIGLGSVDNTSDTDKPISSATQSALNMKQDAHPNIGYVYVRPMGDTTSLPPNPVPGMLILNRLS